MVVLMVQIKTSLPDDLAAWVREQAAASLRSESSIIREALYLRKQNLARRAKRAAA